MENESSSVSTHRVYLSKKREQHKPLKPRQKNRSLDFFSLLSSDDIPAFVMTKKKDIPAFDTNPRRKEFSLIQCISRAESIAESERENNHSRRTEIINRNKRSTEGVLAPTSWKNTSRKHEGSNVINEKEIDSGDTEGETERMDFMINDANLLVRANGSSRKFSKPLNGTTRSNQDLQESSEDCNSPLDKKAGLEGVTWDAEISMMGKRKEGEPTGSIRKSKRAPKKRVFGSYNDNDDEIQFLEKLKYKRVSVGNEDTESGRRQLKPSRITNGGISGKKKTASEESEDMDFAEEREGETTLTSRQQALASGRSSVIDFSDGLPRTSRKKKETLSEMEQQLKKVEAAQRRKVQMEKAARESEEKAAQEERASTCYIRTIMGPNGTTVSFPSDKVPSLFDPTPSGYPPPRENCAGPSCRHPCKYRDLKTELTLCSLKCYKAVQEQISSV